MIRALLDRLRGIEPDPFVPAPDWREGADDSDRPFHCADYDPHGSSAAPEPDDEPDDPRADAAADDWAEMQAWAEENRVAPPCEHGITTDAFCSRCPDGGV